MSRKTEVLCSLTTRVPPREFLAVQICAKEKNMTESAYVRWLICNTVDIHTAKVAEEDLIALKSASVRHRKAKSSSWIKRLFRK